MQKEAERETDYLVDANPNTPNRKKEGEMKYVTLADLVRTIRKYFYRVPHDVDFVIGVPRSGIICGSIISEFLNCPLIDVDSFCSGAHPTGGARLRHHKDPGKKRVLVVDDTIFNGWSMTKTREKLRLFHEYEFIYMAVYLEGPCSDVDVWLEDLRKFADPFVLYEWNIFHHTIRIMSQSIYDIDGVLCMDPPDERAEQKYLDYIENAVPLFTPTVEIGEIVSYRLASNEAVTRQWLDTHGIRFKALTLFPAQHYDERKASGIRPAEFKANIYAARRWARLFVESDDQQAREICRMTRKPVYCVGTNMLYQCNDKPTFYAVETN